MGFTFEYKDVGLKSPYRRNGVPFCAQWRTCCVKATVDRGSAQDYENFLSRFTQ